MGETSTVRLVDGRELAFSQWGPDDGRARCSCCTALRAGGSCVMCTVKMRHLPRAEVIWVDGDHMDPRQEEEEELLRWMSEHLRT
jgi:hypothetical protein